MAFFLKELLDRPLRVQAGFPVGFEDAGGNMGILETNDGYVIDQLRKAEALGVGGVTEITKERYEEVKKKPFKGRRSSGTLRDAIRALPLRQSTSPQAAPKPAKESAVVVEVGQPLSVPASIPTTRKVAQVKAPKPKTRLPVGDE